MDIKTEIKLKLVESKISLTELVRIINKKNDTDKTVQNLDSKLRRETIRYTEVLEIADILNYDIEWVKRK